MHHSFQVPYRVAFFCEVAKREIPIHFRVSRSPEGPVLGIEPDEPSASSVDRLQDLSLGITVIIPSISKYDHRCLAGDRIKPFFSEFAEDLSIVGSTHLNARFGAGQDSCQRLFNRAAVKNVAHFCQIGAEDERSYFHQSLIQAVKEKKEEAYDGTNRVTDVTQHDDIRTIDLFGLPPPVK